MKRATIWIEERLRYNREIEVEIPDEMTDGQLERLFDECERYRADNVDDVIRFLGRYGIKSVDSTAHDDYDCPDTQEVEITEYDIAETVGDTK